jgi:hypothetical protein
MNIYAIKNKIFDILQKYNKDFDNTIEIKLLADEIGEFLRPIIFPRLENCVIDSTIAGEVVVAETRSPMKGDWVRLLDWRNMRSDLFLYYSNLISSYKKDTGKMLEYKQSDHGNWSELGYWD